MKSKLEIIEETALAYTDPKNRAVFAGGLCRYKTPDGRKCAVGRCMLNPSEAMVGTVGTLRNEFALKLDDELKEEYRGHSLVFWADLQNFHDRARNFSDNGISDIGNDNLNTLRIKYANN